MNSHFLPTIVRTILFAAVTAMAGVASAQPFASMAEAANYTGADRIARLAEGAKKEGLLSIYTSAQSDDMGALTAAFEKKYGIKVTIWRASSEKVLQRTLTESQANRHTVDVAETNGPELETMHREKILQAIKSPVLTELIPAAIRPHGEWVGTRLNVFTQAYNTKLVKKEELPKTWEDLLHPRWKGRLGIESEDADWMSGVLSEVGEAKGAKTFKDIVATNGVSVRKGHTLLTQLVASGEVPLALTVYNYKAEQLKSKGAPIDWFVIGTAIARPNGIGVLKKAPHFHAAVLFFDFELSQEGQSVLASRDFVPTNKNVDTPLNKMALKIVDPKVMLDEDAKWTKLYEETFVKPLK